MKRIVLVTLSLILCLAIAAPNAWAGRRHYGGKHYYKHSGRHGYHYGGRHYHYRGHRNDHWGSFALGMGTAIVGGAILHSVLQPAPVVRYETYAPAPSGHWETRRVWVEPSYKRVWEPGRYNHTGAWIAGRWVSVVDQPGYWTEKRVWVTYR